MGSKKRTLKAETSTQKSSEIVIRMGQRLESMEVNGLAFFPCRTCNRLFRKEFEAMQHFQVCKPPELVNISGKISKEVNSTGDIINNNYLENNVNKNFEKNTVGLANKRNTRNSLKMKNIVKSNEYLSVPKKKSIRNARSDVKCSNISSSFQSNVPDNRRKEKEKAVQPKRRGKKLTEEEISERLKIISDKLKKKVEVKVPIEDEEEDERREIEDKLTALNKDREIAFFDDDADFDDRLKDEESLVDSNTEKLENGHSNSSGGSKQTIIVTQRPDGQLHGCRSCSEVFVSELELLRHKRAKHTMPKIIMAPSEIKKFYDVADRSQCPVCKKLLPSPNKSIYLKHLLSHTYVGEHECPVCKKKFKRKDHMRMHEKRHIV